MNPLQYTSEEMFSSTELIRKSKMVFDKLHKKEIEKAIILRDGKPSFMLLDFSEYEKIMTEYLSLKETKDEKKPKIYKEIKNESEIEMNNNEKEVFNEIENKNEKNLDEEDLEKALAQINDLDLGSIEHTSTSENGIKNANQDKEPLKEFWE